MAFVAGDKVRITKGVYAGLTGTITFSEPDGPNSGWHNKVLRDAASELDRPGGVDKLGYTDNELELIESAYAHAPPPLEDCDPVGAILRGAQPRFAVGDLVRVTLDDDARCGETGKVVGREDDCRWKLINKVEFADGERLWFGDDEIERVLIITKDRDEWKKRARELETALLNARADAADANALVISHEGRIETLQAQLDAVHSYNRGLEASLAAVDLQLNDLAADNERLVARDERLEDLVTALRAERDALDEQLAAADASQRDWQESERCDRWHATRDAALQGFIIRGWLQDANKKAAGLADEAHGPLAPTQK